MRAKELAKVDGVSVKGLESGLRSREVLKRCVKGLKLSRGEEPRIALAERAACTVGRAGVICFVARGAHLRAC